MHKKDLRKRERGKEDVFSGSFIRVSTLWFQSEPHPCTSLLTIQLIFHNSFTSSF